MAIAISSRLGSTIDEVTAIDGRNMRLRLKHTLGFMSLLAVYAPTEVCEKDEKEKYYAKCY